MWPHLEREIAMLKLVMNDVHDRLRFDDTMPSQLLPADIGNESVGYPARIISDKGISLTTEFSFPNNPHAITGPQFCLTLSFSSSDDLTSLIQLSFLIEPKFKMPIVFLSTRVNDRRNGAIDTPVQIVWLDNFMQRMRSIHGINWINPENIKDHELPLAAALELVKHMSLRMQQSLGQRHS
jgi:hypothetical protein